MYFDILMNDKKVISSVFQVIKWKKYVVYNDPKVNKIIILIT